MYWFKYIFFLLVTLAIGWVATLSTPNEVFWRMAPLSAGQMCVICWVLASITRFADAGSTCIALNKPGLIEGAPGLGHNPSPRTLYQLALRQSILLAVASAVIGLFYPVVAIFILLVISSVSGMAAINNQILYWLAPKPDPFMMYYSWSAVDSYNQRIMAVQIFALLIAPAIIVLFAGTIIGAQWVILMLPVPRGWVIGTAVIWATYLCFGGSKWIDRFPQWLSVFLRSLGF